MLTQQAIHRRLPLAAAGVVRRMLKGLRRLPWPASPLIRKALVAVLGSILLAAGAMMIFLPGPAVVFIPLGLALLAMEFAWARRGLRQAWLVCRRWGRSRKAPERSVFSAANNHDGKP